MLHHPRRRRRWTLNHQQQFFSLLLLVAIESVVVIQHCNVAPLSQEAYRQLQHEWQSYALTQRDLNRSFVPNWRTDGRCGAGWPASDGSVAICNPFGDSHCCSHWGWCGQTRRHCNPGVINPSNSTHEGDDRGLSCEWTAKRSMKHECLSCRTHDHHVPCLLHVQVRVVLRCRR